MGNFRAMLYERCLFFGKTFAVKLLLSNLHLEILIHNHHHQVVHRMIVSFYQLSPHCHVIDTCLHTVSIMLLIISVVMLTFIPPNDGVISSISPIEGYFYLPGFFVHVESCLRLLM